MSDRIDLFKALMNKEFWNENRHRVSKELFPDMLEDLYDSLVEAHTLNPNGITYNDIYSIHKANNRTLTPANQTIIRELLYRVKDSGDLTPESAAYVLDKSLIELKAKNIAKIALEISEGRHENWDELQKLLSENVSNQELAMVTTDLEQLTKDINSGFKWRYNLPDLDRYLGLVGPGMLNVIAAPVNAGKSALAISLVGGPKGFLEQGAKVLYIGNEESLRKTMLRITSAQTGMTKDEIIADIKKAQTAFDKVRHNLFMVEDYSMTFNKLNHILDKEHPDIVMLDMLDKVGVSKSYQREDQRLGAIYEQARESAKRYDCCVFGLSQTDAKSFGKLYYSFDRLHGSKVEKGANADTVITIGAQSGDFNSDSDNNFRVLNIAKSKNEGNGCKVNCQINPLLSRFQP